VSSMKTTFTDWGMIREAMDKAIEACAVEGGVLDEAAKALISFVPKDPNRFADLAWISTLEGWHPSADPSLWYRKDSGIYFDVRSGRPRVEVEDEGHIVSFPLPSRMVVILLQEAMKEHGK